MRDLLPGSAGSEWGEFKRINGRGHLRNADDDVRTKQEAGAVFWSHRTDENWIDDESIGIVLTGPNRERTRVFGSETSEQTKADLAD